MTELEQRQKEEEQKLLVQSVQTDFVNRQQERKLLERSWQLAINFYCGNQYCDVNAQGELTDEERQFFWQEQRVYNHIAPCIESRCAKLGRIRPALQVRPNSDEEGDVRSARLSSGILSAVLDEIDLDSLLTQGTIWAELCGSAFYKISWSNAVGEVIAVDEQGIEVRQGGVVVTPLSAFEIYPHSLSEEDLQSQPSIIHAKAMSVQDIYALYGVRFAGEDISSAVLAPTARSMHSQSSIGLPTQAVKRGYEVVIERYERPTVARPNGRLTIVCKDTLLYDGDLPYLNGGEGRRGYPFVKQECLHLAGSFFGTSVIDRLIPLQRSYNAVRNRKQEFLNRISMGTIAIEDGSVDADELAEDGLMPGKVLVYRQGGKVPEMLTLGEVPTAFEKEEKLLQDEFNLVAGTSELSQEPSFSGVTSATGLQLLIEQEDGKLGNTYRQIRTAIKEMAKQILRLFRQFACGMHLLKYVGEEGERDVLCFCGSDISSDDVVLEAESDYNMTPAQRRTVLYEMIDRGILCNEQGMIPEETKQKLLEMMGYQSLKNTKTLPYLHRKRAEKENLELQQQVVEIKSYDDHAVHIEAHTAFLLMATVTPEQEVRVLAHIKKHEEVINAGH